MQGVGGVSQRFVPGLPAGLAKAQSESGDQASGIMPGTSTEQGPTRTLLSVDPRITIRAS
jgi:hypothetical protein